MCVREVRGSGGAAAPRRGRPRPRAEASGTGGHGPVRTASGGELRLGTRMSNVERRAACRAAGRCGRRLLSGPCVGVYNRVWVSPPVSGVLR